MRRICRPRARRRRGAVLATTNINVAVAKSNVATTIARMTGVRVSVMPFPTPKLGPTKG